MGTPQFKLITSAPEQNVERTDPIRRLFDHWVFMTGRSPARTKLGPTRRQAIAAALLLYSEDEIQLAIEGNLVDIWCCENDRHEIDWLLVGEGRVERFIAQGERLRLMAQRQEEPARADQASTPASAAAAEAARQRLRDAVGHWKRQRGLHG